MRSLQESPGTRIERLICVIGIILSGGGIVWPVLRMRADFRQQHAGEFILLAGAIGLALYLGYLLWVLTTVQYTLTDAGLQLRQAWHTRQIHLGSEVHLHRWRARWAWSGIAQKELGVAEIELYPPLWLSHSAWVLLCRGEEGSLLAVAFCPSPALLAEVKALVRESKGLAG